MNGHPQADNRLPNGHPQALPSISSLTSGLPPGDRSPYGHQPYSNPSAHDSGNWSMPPSKHSSLASNNQGLHIQTILNAEESPTRLSVPETPSSTRGSWQAPLPSLNQGFDHRQSVDTSSLLESRRSSVDSRMNMHMSGLALGPASPYESQNGSRVSLAASLQQQRGIAPEQRQSNGATPLSPLGTRTTPRPSGQIRRAPVIHPNPRSVSGMPDPTAAAPTKGFAWAFPDKEDADDRRGSSSGDSSFDQQSIGSRQTSYAASVNSGIYAPESGMPAGQRRLDDGIHTHHHSLQHRAVSNLQGSDAASAGTGNYSRTPELRVSHKMAERKRRSEMKSLFDELNSILPNSPGAKSSKWEILTKSIETIKSLRKNDSMVIRDQDRNLTRLHEENNQLRSELTTMWQTVRRADPSNAHVYGGFTNMLAQEQAQNPVGQHGVLPPMHQAQQQPPWAPQPTGAMQDIQYATPRQGYDHR